MISIAGRAAERPFSRHPVKAPFFKKWLMRPSNLEARRALAEALGLHPLTVAVLVARGVLSDSSHGEAA